MVDNNMKQIAAEHAVKYVQDGMKIGLGTGSTAYFAIMKIGELVQSGLRIQAVATSKASERLAIEQGIPLSPIEQVRRLDMTIDGADELDGQLRLIKGGGGALLREKITAFHSERLVIVADESKSVSRLGAFPLPVEIIPFAYEWTVEALIELGCSVRIRRAEGGGSYFTDNGNLIADCQFELMDEPEEIAARLSRIPGVVEHGLFVGMADQAIIGCHDGTVRMVQARERSGKIVFDS
ncbi:ribose 5-phosphate isomerase A [Paenibacillus sp. JCM 10914]|uniref:ribose-5-phosphate isomerase RpiA n=1 Tax=Paenibacillus sp. JCM 10914 TaxID=1236974 RepID=UPI0003CC363B|nr:ribose-5-phosphate isomerase RpiA [Paenibacillus sp. JCM 10914]GAE08558.1 ribose 5-phosphate isomerase A [Paenibacillus sp. JCM 10914]